MIHIIIPYNILKKFNYILCNLLKIKYNLVKLGFRYPYRPIWDGIDNFNGGGFDHPSEKQK